MPASAFASFRAKIGTIIPGERLHDDELRRLVYGSDASFYRLIPQCVVKVESEEEVSALLRAASATGVPVTFRAAGTSLSGQAVTDSVLLQLGRTWKKYAIEEGGLRIRLQPGIVGAFANLFLAQYGRKIGPDPASINAAMIGGIAANNASGMCCGTAQNSYRTLAGMRIILADGTLLDTNDGESRAAFMASHPVLVEGISRLASRTRSNATLADRIRAKYKMKNTTGYSLNALVDFDDPIDILQHLMIGSEGTLGFIAEITYHTVVEHPHKASALMLFPDVETACAAVPALKACGADAVELMDRASLRSVEAKPGMPAYLKSLHDRVASLLVETRAATAADLARSIDAITTAMQPFPMERQIEFTSRASEYGILWGIRKGLFPSVGAMRAVGTTVIIEDVAFPVGQLAQATVDLDALFKRNGYRDAIIFGHAMDGNLHIVFKQDFNAQKELARYRTFMDELVDLVVRRYDGSLKAEHGTGRNVAPFVESEWGAEAYALMREIKSLFDPHNVLNPGVILNDDRQIHIKNLKPLPPADALVDKCVECGFCEVHCPSRDITLTPRQRIVAWREIARLRTSHADPDRLAAFLDAFSYDGNETCATDGLCATSCPVSIDTGALIRTLRSREHSPTARSIAATVASHMDAATAALRTGLALLDRMHRVVGSDAMSRVTTTLRTLSGNMIPSWNRFIPGPASRTMVNGQQESPDVVYFPSCINRSLGAADGDALSVVVVRLLEKAGFRVLLPRGLDNLCCGMPFSSKGFHEAGNRKALELNAAIGEISRGGEIPVLCDMSPCVYRMKEIGHTSIQEPVRFVLDHVVPRIHLQRKEETIAVHTTCSARKMGLDQPTRELAELCAARVVIPQSIECCGWAGDRGFTHPELTASALHDLKASLPEECAGGYSTSRTCEIGLSLHGGITYRSILHLVDECSASDRPS